MLKVSASLKWLPRLDPQEKVTLGYEVVYEFEVWIVVCHSQLTTRVSKRQLSDLGFADL